MPSTTPAECPRRSLPTRRAASLSPDNADAHYNLAIAYFESGNERLALSEAKILRQLDVKLYDKLMSETA